MKLRIGTGELSITRNFQAGARMAVSPIESLPKGMYM
jgi:hypothetical protein